MQRYTADRDHDKVSVWILKPRDLSRGRGIYLLRRLEELRYDSAAVVQRYIHQPHLINHHKFDLVHNIVYYFMIVAGVCAGKVVSSAERVRPPRGLGALRVPSLFPGLVGCHQPHYKRTLLIFTLIG